MLDTLALYLPPDKIFTPVVGLSSCTINPSPFHYLPIQMQLLEPWFQSADPFQRSASLIAVAVITEGCSEYIKNKLVLAIKISYTCTMHVCVTTFAKKFDFHNAVRCLKYYLKEMWQRSYEGVRVTPLLS